MQQEGRLQAASELYRQGLERAPGDPQLHFALAHCAYEQADYAAAIGHYQALLKLKPEHLQGWLNLGSLFARLQDTDRAITCLQQAVRLDPTDAARFSYLLVQSWAAMLEPAARFALFELWNRLHGRPLEPQQPTYPQDRDPGRRLRLGYVSGEFFYVSATLLFMPLFQLADREHFEIFAYSNNARQDQVTERIRQGCDHFVQVQDLSDEQLAERIRADRIDLLVDLSGHTQYHRLGVFAGRPAPLQFTGLGFVSTTGLSAIQYRFTDRWITPPELEPFNSEQCLFLPSLMYWQPVNDIQPYYSPNLPALERGDISFGCVNPPFKVNHQVLSLWARILAACPGSRLLCKSPGFEQPDLQQRYRETFARAGVGPERLVFAGATPLPEHLRFLQQLDLALDPFPYQGGITTCETLAMGVPVLSLAGGTGTSTSVLGTLGLSELIAASEDDYLAKALALAHQPEKLSHWRRELPQRLTRSAVCDPESRVRAIETHYRQCWKQLTTNNEQRTTNS